MEKEDIDTKVQNWLNEQGYPTEFKAANICRSHGFRVLQGYHVRSLKEHAPREIDVIASMDHPSRGTLIRVDHILECKWSRDKPWIVFTSTNGRIQPSACAAQSIGSALGSAAIWMLAGDEKVNSLEVFDTPERLDSVEGRFFPKKALINFIKPRLQSQAFL